VCSSDLLYQDKSRFCIFNGDQPESVRLAEETAGGIDFFRADDVPSDWQIRLPGRHNRQNVAAAMRLTRKLGVADRMIRDAVEGFAGVEHRLQWLGQRDGIEFVNDSTSTTPVAGCAALSALKGRRILLLAGGADKKLDLKPFADAAVSDAARIALLEGTATEALHRGIVDAGGEGKIVGRFQDLRAAVLKLSKEAVPGDVVLLSPGCASFGMFKNEFHRGESFVHIVQELLGDLGTTKSTEETEGN
jgi:UDP-N-acetylmuramoylalanine--D-glutamate ligase